MPRTACVGPLSAAADDDGCRPERCFQFGACLFWARVAFDREHRPLMAPPSRKGRRRWPFIQTPACSRRASWPRSATKPCRERFRSGACETLRSICRTLDRAARHSGRRRSWPTSSRGCFHATTIAGHTVDVCSSLCPERKRKWRRICAAPLLLLMLPVAVAVPTAARKLGKRERATFDASVLVRGEPV